MLALSYIGTNFRDANHSPFATRSGSMSEVSSLELQCHEINCLISIVVCIGTNSVMKTTHHEVGNDAVEDRPLVMEGLTGLAHPFLASAEGTEVLDSFGHGIPEQSEHDASSLASCDLLEDILRSWWYNGCHHFAPRDFRDKDGRSKKNILRNSDEDINLKHSFHSKLTISKNTFLVTVSPPLRCMKI